MTNIAIVVLDTLRKDAFDRHFDWLPGRRFENAWSPSHWTIPVHGSMFTGKYPSESGVRAKSEHLDIGNPVLAEELLNAGYNTRAFSANPYVSPIFGFDRGFNSFSGNWRLRQLDPDLFDWNRFISESKEEGPSRYLRAIARCFRNDCRTVPSLKQGILLKLRETNYFDTMNDDGAAESLKYIQRTDFSEKEFLYLNLMEAHAPYDPPPDYTTADVTHGFGLKETISGATNKTNDGELVKRAYEDCVRYLSDIYEKIFACLAEEFDYVITLADHGELLGDHGGWGHGYGLYQELTHVPMSIYGPSIENGSTGELVSLLDVYATVADLASIEVTTSARSLISDEPNDAYLTEYHGLTNRRLEALQNEGISESTLTLYDQVLRGIAMDSYYGYQTPEDYIEPIGGDIGGKKHLEELVAVLDTVEVISTEDELSKEVLDQLKDLGYA